jgi:HAD superfamily hydrolase (TIGR01549 family)
MAIKGIIFDMDGTITAPNLDFVGIKEQAGIADDVDILDYLRAVTGAEYEHIHTLLMRFEEGGVANAKLNRGVRALLNALARQGIPTALLARNSRRSTDAVCRKLKLKFDVTITREDGPHKPSPEPIWWIARRWKANPQELLMVGDYKWDVHCARNAGTPSAVLISGSGVPDWAREAEFVIDRLVEVIDIVDDVGPVLSRGGPISRHVRGCGLQRIGAKT